MNEKKILIYAQNEIGVLERILMLLRQKRFNLETITASNSKEKGIKKIEISFFGTDEKVLQIVKQIRKIVEIIDVVEVVDKDKICE